MAGSSNRSAAIGPDVVYLIPGFMSPRWMLLPLRRHLRRNGLSATAWDYPRVFVEVEETVRELARHLQAEGDAGRRVGIVAHSFGDWIARSAIHRQRGDHITHSIGVCPVVRSVLAAKILAPLVGSHVPEIEIMSGRRALLPALDPRIRRKAVWSKWDLLVGSGSKASGDITIPGTHNSVLWQRELWETVSTGLSADS